MKHSFKSTALIATLLCASPSMAIVGGGFHWGFDFTTSMNNSEDEAVYTLEDFQSQIPVPITGYENTAAMMVSRTNFDRTAINFGGKIYVDILPVEFEASVNMGVWQYDGVISTFDPASVASGDITYTDRPVTIENIGGVSYFGVDKTPYGKFQADVTIKKTFKDVPLLKPSIGAGATFNFATPVLTPDLVRSALGTDLSGISTNPEESMKKILDEILDGAKKPSVGMHFLVGLQAKLPVIPVGLYADGKYVIMFNEGEPNTGVKNGGFLINTGIFIGL